MEHVNMFSDRAKGHGVEGVTVSFPAKLKLGDCPGISACHQSTEPENYGSRRDSERILEKQGQREAMLLALEMKGGTTHQGM